MDSAVRWQNRVKLMNSLQLVDKLLAKHSMMLNPEGYKQWRISNRSRNNIKFWASVDCKYTRTIGNTTRRQPLANRDASDKQYTIFNYINKPW
jgi:hypothetical protein